MKAVNVLRFASLGALTSFGLNAQTPSITASPNPITSVNSSGAGVTTIYWSAPGHNSTEVHVTSPTGTLFARGSSTGSATTGQWVLDNTIFYLLDSNTGQTLATYEVGIRTDNGRNLNISGTAAVDPATATYLIDEAAKTGAKAVFLGIDWDRIEPQAPYGYPTGSASYYGPTVGAYHSYTVDGLDATIQEAQNKGLTITIGVSEHPRGLAGTPVPRHVTTSPKLV